VQHPGGQSPGQNSSNLPRLTAAETKPIEDSVFVIVDGPVGDIWCGESEESRLGVRENNTAKQDYIGVPRKSLGEMQLIPYPVSPLKDHVIFEDSALLRT
jgi:hypothetical protein